MLAVDRHLSTPGTKDVFSIWMTRSGLNTCFTDAGAPDQKSAITRGFLFSEAFGDGGWWDSSGPNRQARIEGEKRQFSAPLWGQQEMGPHLDFDRPRTDQHGQLLMLGSRIGLLEQLLPSRLPLVALLGLGDQSGEEISKSPQNRHLQNEEDFPRKSICF